MKKLFNIGHSKADTASAGFRIGDCVRVKEGVTYPEAPDIDISGWQGRVCDVSGLDDDPPLIGLKWDSISLRSLPEWVIEESEEEGFDWAELYLHPSEIEPAPPRDSAAAADAVAAELQSRFAWNFLGEEGRRIQAVLQGIPAGDTLAQLDAWEQHLSNTLKFPFEARVAELMERGPLRVDDVVKVLHIELIDDLYGIIVACQRSKKELSAPLADLECTNRQSVDYQPVKDYAIWFANR